MNKSKSHEWVNVILPAFELAHCPNPRKGRIHCTISEDEFLCLENQVAVIYNDRTKSVKSFTYEQDFDFKNPRESSLVTVVMKNGTIAFTAFVDYKDTILSFSPASKRLRIAEKVQ